MVCVQDVYGIWYVRVVCIYVCDVCMCVVCMCGSMTCDIWGVWQEEIEAEVVGITRFSASALSSSSDLKAAHGGPSTLRTMASLSSPHSEDTGTQREPATCMVLQLARAPPAGSVTQPEHDVPCTKAMYFSLSVFQGCTQRYDHAFIHSLSHSFHPQKLLRSNHILGQWVLGYTSPALEPAFQWGKTAPKQKE